MHCNQGERGFADVVIMGLVVIAIVLVCVWTEGQSVEKGWFPSILTEALNVWYSLEFKPESCSQSTQLWSLEALYKNIKLSVGPRANGQTYALSVEKYYPSMDFLTFSNTEAIATTQSKSNMILIMITLMWGMKTWGKACVDQWVNMKPDRYFRKFYFILLTYALINLEIQAINIEKVEIQVKKETENIIEKVNWPS